MDFKTVATKENTITTAVKDNATDLTDNDNAVETSNTKNEETIHEELYMFESHLIYAAHGFQKVFHVVPNIFAWGTKYARKFCMGYQN